MVGVRSAAVKPLHMGLSHPRRPHAKPPAGRALAHGMLPTVLPVFHSLVGQRVDRYDVVAQIGQGGFGVVYRARHSVIGTEVALKVLWSEYADDPAQVERFLREARTAASIGSPHIVHVGDAGTTPEGIVFLAMELLSGHNLEAEIASHGGKMSIEDTAEIVRQILDGLSAAHRRGIVHRDLKPANVFLVPGPDGTPYVKLLDFGISKILGAKSLTTTGMVLGTPQYMAPEQLEGRGLIDARADIYAVGTMLYEMLSGRVPFAGASFDVLVRRIQGAVPAPLRSVAPQIPEKVAAVVQRALAPDRDGRWPSTDAMGDALIGAIDDALAGELSPEAQQATIPPRNRGRIEALAIEKAKALAPVVKPIEPQAAIPTRPPPPIAVEAPKKPSPLPAHPGLDVHLPLSGSMKADLGDANRVDAAATDPSRHMSAIADHARVLAAPYPASPAPGPAQPISSPHAISDVYAVAHASPISGSHPQASPAGQYRTPNPGPPISGQHPIGHPYHSAHPSGAPPQDPNRHPTPAPSAFPSSPGMSSHPGHAISGAHHAHSQPELETSRALHPSVWVALGALAVLMVMTLGAIAFGLFRKASEDDRPERPTAPVPAPAPVQQEERQGIPIRTIIREQRTPPPARRSREVVQAPPPIDLSSIVYVVRSYGTNGPQQPIDALLERARPEVAECAVDRPVRAAVHFIINNGGLIMNAMTDRERTPENDVPIGECIGDAITRSGPAGFHGVHLAMVHVDVTLPAR
jgi:eukaryotic-like serine/threonine-protein kinase